MGGTRRGGRTAVCHRRNPTAHDRRSAWGARAGSMIAACREVQASLPTIAPPRALCVLNQLNSLFFVVGNDT